MYHIAVCDDEDAIRSQIIRVLKQHPSHNEFTVWEFASGEELIDSLRNGATYFLIILDIELKQTNGIEVGRYLREERKDHMTQVLYISAYEQYAMDLFDVRPLNFLIKPIDESRLSSCVTQAMELAPDLDACLTVFINKQALRIPMRSIRYLESYNKCLTIHTTEGDYKCSQRLNEVLTRLPYPDFFQIHQSFAVNDRYVRHIRYDKLTLDNGVELSISQNYRKQVRELIFQRIPKEENACGMDM